MKEFIKNRDIVLFGFQPWEIKTGSNFVDIAHELSSQNRVLFVNRAPDRVSVWKKRRHRQWRSTIKGRAENEIRKINERLWVLDPAAVLESINWIPVAGLHDMLNFINNRRLAERINGAIHTLGFHNVLLINDNDFIRGRYLKELVQCDDCIFYLRDYLTGVPYFRRHGPRLEAKTIHLATMVAANSTYLATYASRWNPHSFDIGQGFHMLPALKQFIPDDIQPIPKPIIGYAGFISTLRIDPYILQHIAEKLPGCSIVMIGQTDPAFPRGLTDGLPNLHFLGPKPMAELYNYMSCFDICINPQILNDITNGNYPRKIDEYLALGKPVVATRTEAMALFAQYSFLCTTKEEYVASIEKILRYPDTYLSADACESRMLFASGHTWKNSLSRLSEAYFNTKNLFHPTSIHAEPVSKTSRTLRLLTIYCLVLYLLFIYIKFLFF